MGQETMELDIDVTKFLREQRQKSPAELHPYFDEFVDLYERKLWHQLTLKYLQFITLPASKPLQIQMFKSFIADWVKKMNKLHLVTIALSAARQFQDYNEAIQFLESLTKDLNDPESQDSYVHATMETAYFRLLLGDLDRTKLAMNECGKILDRFDSVDPAVHASYYRVCADYYKARAEYAQYYKHALLYLASVNVEELSLAEQVERAYDISIAALMADTIYNFGELLMHPILDTLKDTPHDWLRKLLFAFNSGDIGKFEAIAPQFATNQPLLQANLTFLRQKICLMSLIEAVFTRGSENRSMAFSQIAQETRLPIDEVEHLVMKALSLGLLRAKIDQVAGVVRVSWVQPRVLSRPQIEGMARRLKEWNEGVKETASFVEQEGAEIFAGVHH
ncbi:uncharacterized protein VTP21DRAFT_9305 [Calcarisporiella thermophila]|uniref:uncharacterized protein n=1 Tax=Calcarisporiella thermophila TaxID=911321 RepID=UPI0037425A5E